MKETSSFQSKGDHVKMCSIPKYWYICYLPKYVHVQNCNVCKVNKQVRNKMYSTAVSTFQPILNQDNSQRTNTNTNKIQDINVWNLLTNTTQHASTMKDLPVKHNNSKRNWLILLFYSCYILSPLWECLTTPLKVDTEDKLIFSPSIPICAYQGNNLTTMTTLRWKQQIESSTSIVYYS